MDRAPRSGTQGVAPEALASVVYSRAALDDLERLVTFLAAEDPAAAVRSAELIAASVSLLADHPLIGPARDRGLRELIISLGRTGYVALYRFVTHLSEVRVLRIRHQRELDYPR